jgi:hypothetical protein
VTGHPVNRVVRNSPCDKGIFCEHDACGCATANHPKSATERLPPCVSLPERTCARLLTFSKPRGTPHPSQRAASVCQCVLRPVADTGGDSSSSKPLCSPGYRCHGSDSILISQDAESCILEQRSNGQCIIDSCKTGVAQLTVDSDAYQTSARRQTPGTSVLGALGVEQRVAPDTRAATTQQSLSQEQGTRPRS